MGGIVRRVRKYGSGRVLPLPAVMVTTLGLEDAYVLLSLEGYMITLRKLERIDDETDPAARQILQIQRGTELPFLGLTGDERVVSAGNGREMAGGGQIP